MKCFEVTFKEVHARQGNWDGWVHSTYTWYTNEGDVEDAKKMGIQSIANGSKYTFDTTPEIDNVTEEIAESFSIKGGWES